MDNKTREKILQQACKAFQRAGIEAEVDASAKGWGVCVTRRQNHLFFYLECAIGFENKYKAQLEKARQGIDPEWNNTKCVARWVAVDPRPYNMAPLGGVFLREFLSAREAEDLLDHLPIVERCVDGLEVSVYVDDDPWHAEALLTLERLFPQVKMRPDKDNNTMTTRWLRKIHITPTERNLPCDIYVPRFRGMDWTIAFGRYMSFDTPDEMEAYAMKFRGLKDLYATMQRATSTLDLPRVPDTSISKAS